MLGAGYSGTGDNGDLEIFGPNTSGLTIEHMYAHNAGCVFVQDVGNGTTVDHSYFWATQPNGSVGCHGQAEYETGGTSNGVRSNNVYRDIMGTAIWTFASGAGTANNWEFYNNSVVYSSPLATWVSSAGVAAPSDAVVDCINSGVNCTNFTFVQNNTINVPSFGQNGFGCENTCTWTVQNNIWYGNSNPAKWQGTFSTESNNSFLNTGGCPGSGSNDVCVRSGAPDPYNNWAASTFTLASDNSDWNNRSSLGSPYTVDAAGNAFTTDRGAYQFGAGDPPPSPPSGLNAVVN